MLLAPRSIVCGVPNLMIVSGIQQALSLVGRLFIDPGDTVILENLTYPGALSVFRSLQADCVGVPVDGEGISVEVLAGVLARRRAKLLYTIPTFQNPTGTVLSPERRRRLVELCRGHGVLILEDDYAHELAFDGREALPLKALDSDGGVISLGSFSEALFPGIRLSWILADPRIIERLLRLKETSDLYTNRILQAALLEFCRRGFYERSLKRRTRILRSRRDALEAALREHLPPEASWKPPAGGSFQWVDLPPRLDALALLMETRKRGVTFAPDRMFSVDEWKRAGMRLGFSENEEGALAQGARIIAEVMREMLA
jgi:GntR family transcriptional regulator